MIVCVPARLACLCACAPVPAGCLCDIGSCKKEGCVRGGGIRTGSMGPHNLNNLDGPMGLAMGLLNLLGLLCYFGKCWSCRRRPELNEAIVRRPMLTADSPSLHWGRLPIKYAAARRSGRSGDVCAVSQPSRPQEGIWRGTMAPRQAKIGNWGQLEMARLPVAGQLAVHVTPLFSAKSSLPAF